ncbi:MAG: hypothetical protein RLZZ380_643 [Actinomycetota bacterium]|jgi:hypothetical protein
MPKSNYDYRQHPHVEARKAAPPKVTHHRKNKLSLNDRIGLGITKRVGSMWAAYAFGLLTLVSLPAAIASGSPIIIVAWIAQTFLQLVLLPIIIVGQNLQAHETEKRAIATYDDAGAILEEAKQIQSHLTVQDTALNHLIDRLEAIETKIINASKK